MGEVLTPDICVIGAGCGGVTAALAAAAFGVPVVLVEKATMGGTHLNTGCVPSKALIAAACRAEALRQAKAFGLIVPRPKTDFYQVHDHVQGVIEAAAPNFSAERLTGLGVRVVQGAARFEDQHTLAVGSDIKVKARRFIVATGSSPAIPLIPGIEEAPYLTNETIFELLVCPKHLAVLGATSVGLELAQAYRRLGAEVTVLDTGQPLMEEDPECAAVVLDQLEREDIVLRTGVEILRIKGARSKIHIVIGGDDEKIEASHLLIAAGRKPNIEELNLDAAGIKYGPEGIIVDAGLRSSNKKVYAIGDAAGTHSSSAARKHAEAVIGNALFRRRAKVKSSEIPRVTYTQPELAHVGLIEAEASRGLRILRFPYLENDRARAERQTSGHIKVITTKRGRILGTTIVGAEAGEMITAWALAISQGMDIRTVAELAAPYSAYGDIGKQAAMSYFIPGLARPFIRRIISFLRLFG